MYFCAFTTTQRQKFPAVFNMYTTLANCGMIHVKKPTKQNKGWFKAYKQ